MGISLTPVELRPPLEGGHLLLGVGEYQDIVYRVNGGEGGRVELVADPDHFELASGERITSLDSATFDRVVEWRLKAIAPGDNLRIEITATVNGDRQTASLPVVIRGLPGID